MHRSWSKGILSKLLPAGVLAGILALPVPVLAQGHAGSNQQDQQPAYSSSIQVDNRQDVGEIEAGQARHGEEASAEGEEQQEASESQETAALAGKAAITLQQAESAVLKANPDAVIVRVELDNENGSFVYSVVLSTGQDVKVDAGNGTILHIDQAGADEERSE
jgi:uncharacterized membrane protein YkoI